MIMSSIPRFLLANENQHACFGSPTPHDTKWGLLTWCTRINNIVKFSNDGVDCGCCHMFLLIISFFSSSFHSENFLFYRLYVYLIIGCVVSHLVACEQLKKILFVSSLPLKPNTILYERTWLGFFFHPYSSSLSSSFQTTR